MILSVTVTYSKSSCTVEVYVFFLIREQLKFVELFKPRPDFNYKYAMTFSFLI